MKSEKPAREALTKLTKAPIRVSGHPFVSNVSALRLRFRKFGEINENHNRSVRPLFRGYP